ncbi:TerD family protein [Nocardia sp. NBC_00416]|uniref:TerD family protein n=1 Tax=Nocardia sp. NBC_00416 TaxID=2975991 RepID=UPI002E1E295C
MSQVISKGGNVTVRGGRLRISALPAQTDLTVLCLLANGKVGSDSDFVFYNQPASPDGSVRLVGGAIELDLRAVAATTDKFVVAASVDSGHFGGIALSVRISEDNANNADDADDADAYDLPITGLTTETTVVLAEVYRRAGAWKIRNVGQGYATGLAGLATDFGITVDDEPGAASSPPPVAPAAGPPPTAPAGPHVLAQPGNPAPQPVPAAAYPTPSPAPAHPAAPPAAPGVTFSKGSITLTKGAGPVLLEKAPLVRLRVAWASGTDYEAYALVVLADGQVVHVATFPAAGIPANPGYNGLVRHLGDRGRGDVQRGDGRAEEIIEVRLSPEIVAVIPVAYSAINNGTGSFHKYRVTLSIENGADSVSIPADQAKKSGWIFTCVPGIVYNRPEGVLIERLELYSRRFSEHRPAAILHPDGRVEVRMDKGPVNRFKADST